MLEQFRGLSGRMQEKELNGTALIDNSNSGMDILSAEKALEYALLKKKDEKKEKYNPCPRRRSLTGL
ncbi:hypothetical protein [Methanosarcina horonobensis]|uniref:hypothetical protein n=1 Tax=Methanosarcina horonobensis TaxID=418008 RepID=UPI0022B876A6|nr:hypothetical protein [Methanosarcina horonobensis]